MYLPDQIMTICLHNFLDERQERSQMIRTQNTKYYLSLTNICYPYNLIIRIVRVVVSHSYGWDESCRGSQEKKLHCKSEPTRSSNTRAGKRQNDYRNLQQNISDMIRLKYYILHFDGSPPTSLKNKQLRHRSPNRCNVITVVTLLFFLLRDTGKNVILLIWKIMRGAFFVVEKVQF